jgi:hypothetical protein
LASVVCRSAARQLEGACGYEKTRDEGGSSKSLTRPAMTVERGDRFGCANVSNGAAGAAAFKEIGHNF